MSRPRLLDLFCGQGGAGAGYNRAGFDVVGVDIAPQPRYPFPFVCMDALEAMRVLLTGGFITDNQGRNWYLSDFDAIHASPPCQGYSPLKNAPNRDMSEYPMLVEPTRAALRATDKPWVIENVPQAPLKNALVLCGTMFGLKLHKHRAFEIAPPLYFAPAGRCRRDLHVKAKGQGKRLAVWVNDTGKMATIAGHMFSMAVGRAAMDIDWMTRDGLAEAIPPAYTEYIGVHLLQHLAAAQAVTAVRVEAAE